MAWSSEHLYFTSKEKSRIERGHQHVWRIGIKIDEVAKKRIRSQNMRLTNEYH